MKTRLLFTLLTLAFCLTSTFANWQRDITNYTRKEYRAGTQNWMITQQTNGWVYFANNKGLLEFDGANWHTYSMNGNKTRSLCIGEDRNIYIGGMEEFGYFTANNLGGLDYHRLSDRLKEGHKVNVIWNIHAADNRVYFQADWNIYCKEGDSLYVIPNNGPIKHSALIHRKLYVAHGKGLSIVNGKRLQPLPNTQGIGNYKVVSLLPLDDKILIVTQSNGLYLYDGHSVQPYQTAAAPFLAHNPLFCAAIHAHTLALGSIQNGVLLVDLDKDRTEQITTENGLQNKTILSAAFDQDANLWLGLDNGIDYIHLNSSMFLLYGNRPVVGSGYSSCVYHGKLYLGTNQGLYDADFVTSPDTDIHLKRIHQVSGQVWDLQVHDDKLFCSSDNGIFILSDNRIEHLPHIKGAWTVVSTGQADKLLTGTYRGLYLLKKVNGEWTASEQLNGHLYSCKNVFPESSNVIWASNKGDGLFRITLSEDLEEIVKTQNYNNESLPKDKGVSMAYIDNQLIIATINGLFRYNPTKDQIEPYEKLERQLKGKKYYRLLQQTAPNTLWYVTNETLYMAYRQHKQDTCPQNYAFLRHSLIEGFEHIHQLDSTQLIAGTEEGFTLLKDAHRAPAARSLNLQIRKVFSIGRHDSLVYGRSYAFTDTTLVFPYSHNSIRVVCSANNYRNARTNHYSFRLKGDKDEEWSAYSESNIKEYTDLHEGNYTLQVRLQGSPNTAPTLTSLRFRVLPPWYRSWIMYIVYLLCTSALLFYLYLRGTAHQKAIIRRQQEEMAQQEQAFQQETQWKNEQINSLEEKNLQLELQHKTEELIRTTLNIVRKNEILQEIKKEANNISKATKEENLVNIRRSTLRLINNIDTNLEHDNDIQAFETAFDSVHHDFFKLLDSRFPGLNKKEKMLCAYLKMDLMSKEIAPLLNISLRGVEIARYRLRKKLALEEGANLAEFLQKLA